MLRDRRYFLILLAIFIFNFIFKLIRIADSSFWYDEMISVQDTLLDFGHIKHEAEWDKNPPFYHYILWIWSKIFGISEWAVRSMSAFFSSLAAILIFVLARKISSIYSAALIVILFTFHPLLFYYSQEARCYSLLIFLVLVNLNLLYTFLTAQAKSVALMIGVMNFLIFYTHYIAGIFLCAQFIFVVVYFRSRIGLLALMYITPIVMVLWRFTRKQYDVLLFSGDMSKEKANVPLSNLDYLLNATNQLFISNIILIGFSFLVVILMVKHFGKFRGIMTNPQLGFKIFIIFVPVFSIIILFLIGRITNVFDAKYLLFSIPFIVISIGILPLRKEILMVCFLVVLFFEIPKIKFGQTKHMDYRLAAKIAKNLKDDRTVILIQTHDVVSLFLYYYDFESFLNRDFRSKEELSKENIYFFNSVAEIENFDLDTFDKAILFQTYAKREEAERIIMRFEEGNYKVFNTRSIENIQFFYFLKKNLSLKPNAVNENEH
jgi:uncharacterized membrane protein